MRIAVVAVVIAAVLGCTLGTAAHAALVDDINALRLKGCRGHAGAPLRLRASPDLDAVARAWSRGGRLREALAATGYRALNSASMRIEGAPDKATLLQAIADNYCDTLTNPVFTSIGITQTAQNVHIVVALPFVAPRVSDSKAINERALTLVNAARATPRKCGSGSFTAVPPVRLSALLTQAALVQAQDMAQHNFFEHEGSDLSLIHI